MALQENQFPTKANCDPTVPEEAFVWMLVGAPGQDGAPLTFPVGYLKLVSKRMWDCGARPDMGPQVIKYIPPMNGTPHWATNPGEWVPIDAPDPVAPTIADVFDALPQADQAAIAKHVQERQFAHTPEASAAAADGDRSDLVPYYRKDGSTVMVTRAQAQAWRARRREAKQRKEQQ